MRKEKFPDLIFLILSIFVLIFTLCFMFARSAKAESEPKIDYVQYNERGFTGHVFNVYEDDVCYMWIAFSFDGEAYLMTIVPIDKHGNWEAPIISFADSVKLQIINKPYAFLLDECLIFDFMNFEPI